LLLLVYKALLDTQIDQLQNTYRENLQLHKNELMSAFGLTPNSSGYQHKTLTVKGQTHDISWSRFSQHFPSIGTIIFALAGFIALTILFIGRF